MAKTKCLNCGGEGGWILRTGIVECPDCNGKGSITKEPSVTDIVKCLYCNGAGGFSSTSGETIITCPDCKGTGKMPACPYDVEKGLERFKRALEEREENNG